MRSQTSQGYVWVGLFREKHGIFFLGTSSPTELGLFLERKTNSFPLKTPTWLKAQQSWNYSSIFLLFHPYLYKKKIPQSQRPSPNRKKSLVTSFKCNLGIFFVIIFMNNLYFSNFIMKYFLLKINLEKKIYQRKILLHNLYFS